MSYFLIVPLLFIASSLWRGREVQEGMEVGGERWREPECDTAVDFSTGSNTGDGNGRLLFAAAAFTNPTGQG
jgi:hypothetical protein